jgi:uncharacterized protein YndB with AHSA1/START domain
MPDIFHEFPVKASVERVFEAVATPGGLDLWWTLRSSGDARVGGVWELFFGEGYDWRAVVTRCEFGRLIEWQMTPGDADWKGTRVGIELAPIEGGTRVNFWHTGWPEANAPYRISAFCWAMYLRLMKKWCETGDVVDYARRLDA